MEPEVQVTSTKNCENCDVSLRHWRLEFQQLPTELALEQGCQVHDENFRLMLWSIYFVKKDNQYCYLYVPVIDKKNDRSKRDTNADIVCVFNFLEEVFVSLKNKK